MASLPPSVPSQKSVGIRPALHRFSAPTRLPRWGPGSGCVAHRSNIPDILTLRALPSGRIAALGAQRISDSGHSQPAAGDQDGGDGGGQVMLIGAQSIIYSTNPDADRDFLRDVLSRP